MSQEAVITIPVACNRTDAQIGGLNKRDESVGFLGSYAPYMKNMVVETTRVRKRRGYSKVGTNLPLSGTGVGLFEYIDASSNIHLIAFTTTSAYEYDPSVEEWVDISPDTPFSGDSSNRFFATVATDMSLFDSNGGSALIVTNDYDDIHFYEGETSDKFTILPHGYASFASCADAIEFRNHLILLGITTTELHTRLMAWFDFGNVDEPVEGTSGSSVLTDSVGSIRRGMKLGSDLAIYSDQSISICSYVGSSVVFEIPTLVYSTGLLCLDGIWNFYNFHVFIGSDLRVYRYYGGSQLEHIGGSVESSLFAEMNYTYRDKVVAMYDPIRYKLYFFFPRANDDQCHAAYAMATDLYGNPWEYHEFADSVCASAVLRIPNAIYADSSVWGEYYADELLVYFDGALGQEEMPVCCFLSHDGYVYALSEATGYDDDEEITCEYQTEDITVDAEESFARWQWFSFSAMSETGGSVVVQYSTDGGDDWTTFSDSPVTLTATWTTYRIPLDESSRRIRFRFLQETADDLQLRSSFKITAAITGGRD